MPISNWKSMFDIKKRLLSFDETNLTHYPKSTLIIEQILTWCYKVKWLYYPRITLSYIKFTPSHLFFPPPWLPPLFYLLRSHLSNTNLITLAFFSFFHYRTLNWHDTIIVSFSYHLSLLYRLLFCTWLY